MKRWSFLLVALPLLAAADKPEEAEMKELKKLEGRWQLIRPEGETKDLNFAWVVKGKGYVGEAAIEKVRTDGVRRKLVGFRVAGRGIARHGYPIHRVAAGDVAGERIGEVTSGTVAPTVGGAVGIGYVPIAHAKAGTRLVADCRGKPAVIEIVDGPFYRRARS